MNIVAHNLSAMNAQRQFGINTRSKAKSTEKLSSGYKINRAADDAAGLAISEKMRRQIRGLNQAAENIQEGISLVQVADGALNETHDILQRMNELAVQAANGTNSSEDREYIQCEIEQLIEEVDRIANDTSFNEEIFPLKGIDDSKLIDGKWILPDTLSEWTIQGTVAKNTTIDGIEYNAGDVVQYTYLYYTGDGIGLTADIGMPLSEPYKSAYFDYWSSNGIGGISVDDLREKTDTSQSVYIMTSNPYLTYFKSTTLADLHVDNDGYIWFESNDYNPGYIQLADMQTSTSVIQQVASANDRCLMAIEINESMLQQDKCWIQMGAETGHGMYIDFVDATASGLGVTDVNVSTQDNASVSISTIKNALNKVSKYRSNFGAQQNRLEHGYNANLNTAENTTAAESRIRDTDMAKEMVKYTNLNILEQVSHAIMAQANQSNQGVLKLLQ